MVCPHGSQNWFPFTFWPYFHCRVKPFRFQIFWAGLHEATDFFVVSFSYVDHGQILLDVGLLQERLPADWLLGGLQSLCSKIIPRLYHGAEALSQRPRAGDGQNYKGPPLATVLRKEG